MTYGVVTVRGKITALSPIFHGGNEKTGSVVLLNRLTFLVDGKPTEVPIISGNEIRGYLRRLITRDFLRRAGYEIDVTRKGGRRLYHALFSGGLLETTKESEVGVVDLNLRRRVYELLLPVRLLGMSWGNQIFEGKLMVGHALPVCRELADYLPGDLRPELSFYSLITHGFQTRRDELRVSEEPEEGKRGKRKRREDQAVQMLVEYELFAPGTVFHHEFRLVDPEPIDLATFSRVLELWREYNHIGGRGSAGCGTVRLDYDFEADSRPYAEFVEGRKGEIARLLDEMSGNA